METQEVTYKVKLITDYTDPMGYTQFIFENLDYVDPDYHYISCVMFPHWNQGVINIGDIGYVTVRYVREGIDQWFDGKSFNTYQYSNVIFLRFIAEKKPIDIKEIVID